MLQVICGEDSSAAYAYVNQLKEDYLNKGYEMRSLENAEFISVKELNDQHSLFNQKAVFLINNLSKLKNYSKQTDLLNEIHNNTEIVCIDFEKEIPKYLIRFPTSIPVKEFKYSESVFQLLDSCVPGNKVTMLQLLHDILKHKDAMFVYYLLIKHIRLLLLARYDEVEGIAPWQKYKILKQAKLWEKARLINLYEGLCKLDYQTKSSFPLSLQSSLEILLIHYL